MSDGKQFDFLVASWGLKLSEKGRDEIADYLGDSLNQKDIEEYIKDSDLRKLGVESTLPKDLTRFNGDVPSGQYLVQVVKIVDITQPAKFQEEFEGGKWRLLLFDLTDGLQRFRAIEYGSLDQKNFGVHVPPGSKFHLSSTEKAPLRMQNGHMLLDPNIVWNIGGNVEKLLESWYAAKEVEENRLLWRSEGVKKKSSGEGAPPWSDFNAKKASGRGLEDWRKDAAEERRQWMKGVTVATSKSLSQTVKDDDEGEERKGPRFQVQEFKDADATLKSTVTSQAFKQQEMTKAKGKGGGKEGGGKRGRRGNDDDYQEEKRAPVATSSLMAFIKPTKDGVLPEAAKIILESATESKKAGGGAWDAAGTAWDEDSSWSAGGDWGASSWSGAGAGWSSGGGGGRGGRGGGRKGGGSKGGSRGGKGGGGGRGGW